MLFFFFYPIHRRHKWSITQLVLCFTAQNAHLKKDLYTTSIADTHRGGRMKKMSFLRQRFSASDVLMEINCFQFISKHSTESSNGLKIFHFASTSFFRLNLKRQKNGCGVKKKTTSEKIADWRHRVTTRVKARENS